MKSELVIKMKVPFSKFQGTGNDFVMIDNREFGLDLTQQQIATICNRKFGVGGDGLILIEIEDGTPKMVYYNSDGADSSMCGNGGRCFVKFCHELGIFDAEGEFLAVDGLHHFRIDGDKIHLKMGDVNDISRDDEAWVIETGSPHYIEEADVLDGLDIIQLGRSIRYSEKYSAEGINVNVVETDGITALMRTYERGVEDETLSCGTGATAVAVMLAESKNWESPVSISTLGGKLEVAFRKNGNLYEDVWLIGPAAKTFDGEIEI